MPKVTEEKLSCVLLRQLAPGKWRVDYRDPLTRQRHRVQVPATTYKDAKKEAQAIDRRLAAGTGFSGRMRGGVGHTMSAAVLEAVTHTGANEATRADYLRRYNAFSEFLAEHLPGVESWSAITEKVIESYLEHCRKSGVSHDTIRMRLYVLRLTSAYIARTYPGTYRHVTANVKLRRHDPPRAELELEQAILPPAKLRELLAWLREQRPMVYVWALLQGVAGLREKEAGYLREQDFDPEARTITIAATGAHKPQNRPSYRTIPVAPAVAEALAAWVRGLKTRHCEGYLFLPERAVKGRHGAVSDAARVGALTPSRITHLWAEALGREPEKAPAKVQAPGDGQAAGKAPARKSGKKAEAQPEAKKTQTPRPELPAAFIPRKLRASFVTAMRGAGADLADLQSYIGHAPATVLSAHYDQPDLGRLRKIAGLGQQLFEGAGAFRAEAGEAKKASGFGH